MNDRPQRIADGLEYRPNWMSDEAAGLLMDTLWRGLPWTQRSITLFGQARPQPRLTAWVGDRGASYSYSGLDWVPTPWPEALVPVRARLEAALGVRFNSVLANAYRNGADSMGWHADDEAELGRRPVIASLSFGATRRFLVKPRSGGRAIPVELENGSLLTMHGDFQQTHRHALPKTRRPVGLRINLTFRRILDQALSA